MSGLVIIIGWCILLLGAARADYSNQSHVTETSTRTDGWINSTRNVPTVWSDANGTSHQNTTLLVPIQKRASVFLEFKIGVGVHTYLPGIVLPFGFIGNLLSFLVMTQRRNRRRSTSLYMAALAVTDTVVLCMLSWFWASTVLITDPWITSAHCKWLGLALYFSSEFGVFIIMFMTVDRCIAVRFPLKASSFCTVARTKKVLLFGGFAYLLYNIPMLWEIDYNKGICTAFISPSILSKVYSWSYVVVNAFIPFMTLLVCNSLIISAIHARRDQLSSISKEVQGQGKEDRAAERQLTVMLLLVTFAFLILTMPQFVRFVVFLFVDFRSDPYDYAVYMLAYHLSQKLWFTNR